MIDSISSAMCLQLKHPSGLQVTVHADGDADFAATEPQIFRKIVSIIYAWICMVMPDGTADRDLRHC